jgi:hypothetical protein
LIDVYSNFETVKKEKNWIKDSIDWYKNGDLNEPIVFYTSNSQKSILKQTDNSTANNDVIITELTETKISFQTNDLNKLHIIKVSYFPTWKVRGGSGPFLVSPSFIGIIPTQNNVTVYFSKSIVDKMAYLLTYISIVIVCIQIFKPKWLKFL